MYPQGKSVDLWFDDEYTPTRLRNWEIPHWYPERCMTRTGHTKTISNEKGGLLPGVPRSSKSPWGHYLGTWHLPNKITRELANELSAPDPDKITIWYKRYEQAKGELPLVRTTYPETLRKLIKASNKAPPKVEGTKPTKAKKAKPVKQEEIKQKDEIKAESPSSKKEEVICKCEDVKVDNAKEMAHVAEDVALKSPNQPRQELPPLKEIPMQKEILDENDNRKKVLYIPGDYTNPNHRHPSYDFLVEQTLKKSEESLVQNRGYPKYREDFSRPCKEVPSSTLKSKVTEFYDKHKNMLCEHIRHKTHRKEKDPKAPYVAAAKNFALAKQLHKENLEHVPLPDTITDALYRKMQLHKGCCEPGLALKDGNYATGVAWKGYPGFGANRCTKLRIFRPKTGNERPPSVCSFDKKWRFIRQHKVTPIELAIYWDMTPVNPSHEPKRSFHIDGTDFSAGPAVFHKVSTPKDNEEVASRAECRELSNKNALFTNLAQTERPKTSWEKQKSKTPSDDGSCMRRAKSAVNIHTKSESSSISTISEHSSLNNNKDFYQSSPNLVNNVRTSPCSHPCRECQLEKSKTSKKLCMACDLKARRLNIQPARPKSDFKMAFKAGVPNNLPVSTINHKNVSNLKIPKQRDPYSIKNYSIASLGAPFSLQKGKRDDYPEHWRLASVYQHSYKPVHTRKRPLLATVFQ